MRYLCLLAVLLLLPVDATAQQRREGRPSNDRGANRGSGDRASGDRDSGNRDSGDRGSNQRQAEQRSIPSNPSMPWWEQPQTPWWERQTTPWWEKGRQAPSPQSWNPARALLNPPPVLVNQRQDFHDQQPGFRDERQYRKHTGASVIYVLPAYRYFPYTYPGVTEAYVTPPAPTQFVSPVPPQAPPTPLGFLHLEVEPREHLQVFVDGVYIGTPADLGDEIALAPGVHRIELRAPGFRTLTFDTEILDERLITYRGALERREASQQAVAPAAIATPAVAPGPTTMYVIPGCYLGNVAPTQGGLRPGCDISKLVTITP